MTVAETTIYKDCEEFEMNSSEINYVISEMSKVLDFTFENVEVRGGEGIFISSKDFKTVIECSSKTELCRALSVLKKNRLSLCKYSNCF